MTRTLTAITLLALGLTGLVLAQDEPVTAPESSAATTNTPAATPANAPADNGTYLPSEEISDDLSVSFPVDI